MLYEYPYKYYRVGSYIFTAVVLFAIFSILTTSMSIVIKIIFTIIMAFLTKLIWGYYNNKVYDFAAANIQVLPKRLKIKFDYKEFSFAPDDIKSIYYVEQVENIKLFKILHIFTEDDHYFYFSNEIIDFKKLTKDIEKYYPDKLRVIDYILKNSRGRSENQFHQAYLKNRKS